MDKYGRPDREAAQAAWAEFGERVIAERGRAATMAWGEDQFGAPPER